ncbi:MFS transporter [Jatrophihabitans sp.]|uniref:MFS transporter n=1 Tax=Jatrophihabitans sp. TaxID=1932789 RepID=UPI002EF3C0DF
MGTEQDSTSKAGPAVPVAAAAGVEAANRISPIRFIVGFGIVSALADMVYEGARSIIGPYLGTLGASAAVVGVITGAGEAAALVLRLVTGKLADRLGRPWPQTMLGYALTAVCVPLLAVSGSLPAAGLLYNGERVGKAVRTPARDSMLAHASAEMGRGYAFGLHEALDKFGAMAGPLVIAVTLALGGHYRLAFVLLAIPGALALLALARLRRAAPDPTAWEPAAQVSEKKKLRLDARLPAAFWLYAAFSATTMLGFSTWAVLAYHLTSRHLISASLVPVLYALAMAAASAAAVGFGRIYDRVGLRGLLALPPLAAAVPLLSFSTTTGLLIAGALVWGAGMGIHDSTMRAAVADLVPPHRRGGGYGTFTAIYGLAWLAGAALIGLLYEHGAHVAVLFIGAVQLCALGLLIPLLRRTRRPS